MFQKIKFISSIKKISGGSQGILQISPKVVHLWS